MNSLSTLHQRQTKSQWVNGNELRMITNRQCWEQLMARMHRMDRRQRSWIKWAVMDENKLQFNCSHMLQLMSAIGKSSTNSIYCISGDCGSGKTSTLAQLITKLLPKGKTECSVASPDGSKKPYKVFFHLSTQVAGANSLNVLLSRLLYEIYGYKEVQEYCEYG